jgi:hypothetical protein
MINSLNMEACEERYESMILSRKRVDKMVHYIYSTEDGNIFECVKSSLKKCREARQEWCRKELCS